MIWIYPYLVKMTLAFHSVYPVHQAYLPVVETLKKRSHETASNDEDDTDSSIVILSLDDLGLEEKMQRNHIGSNSCILNKNR
jgi:hypothetical protein